MGPFLPRSFVDHPRSVGETYGEHFAVALGFGLRLIAAGAACVLHAVVPCWFTRTGSRAVRDLAREMNERAAGGMADYALRANPPYAVAADSASDWASLQSRSRS